MLWWLEGALTWGIGKGFGVVYVADLLEHLFFSTFSFF
jgi:hypothetical protein